MLKKLVCLTLATMMVICCFAACGSANEPVETTQTVPTEPAGEAEVLKVLTLGHSLTVDSCHMLNLVAAAEGYEGKMVIGTLYYSGCALSQHVQFLKSGAAEYDLYLSSTETPEVPPKITNGITMEYALQSDYWDIIILQGNPWEIDGEEAFTAGYIPLIQEFVNTHKRNPNAIFAWHFAWAMPGDEALLKSYPFENNPHYNNYVPYNFDKSAHYNAMLNCVKKYIVPDETFSYVIASGTAIQNAWSSYLEEADLHRDYGHVTDYGRVIAAYTWYCTLTGVDQLEQIKLDAIPKAFLKSTENKAMDRVLTEGEKNIILESVNNALKAPLEMTQSQYTERPAD